MGGARGADGLHVEQPSQQPDEVGRPHFRQAVAFVDQRGEEAGRRLPVRTGPEGARLALAVRRQGLQRRRQPAGGFSRGGRAAGIGLARELDGRSDEAKQTAGFGGLALAHLGGVFALPGVRGFG